VAIAVKRSWVLVRAVLLIQGKVGMHTIENG